MIFVLDETEDENKLSDNYTDTLIVNSLSRLVIEIVHSYHVRIDQFGRLGQSILEVGKKWWIVQRPFRCVLSFKSL